MKKSYEKMEAIITISLLVLIFELFLFIVVSQYKLLQYKKLTGVVEKNDMALFVLDEKDRRLLYKNSSLILLDKKKKYSIEKDEGVLFQKNQKKYYGIILKFDFPKSYTANETIEIVLKKEKCSIYKVLKNIWEGDNY